MAEPENPRRPGSRHVGTGQRTSAVISELVVRSLWHSISITVLVLLLFQAAARPDVRVLRSFIPIEPLGGVVVAGVIFTVANATLEELVFRGILFDALHSRWGGGVTLTAMAWLFGLGHLQGYPPGPLGACLAASFGFALGALRLKTDGLALPVVAHMAADAVIYWILVHSSAV